MIAVHLTDLELGIARHVANQRNTDGGNAGADAGKYGYEGSTLELHYTGCLGEMAFAKGLNRYWSGAGCTYHQDDDVGHIQVRATSHTNGRLLVRPNEGSLDDPWVLVVGKDADHQVVGWLWGREVRQEKWLFAPNGRPPAYFAPQSALRPVRRRRP